MKKNPGRKQRRMEARKNRLEEGRIRHKQNVLRQKKEASAK